MFSLPKALKLLVGFIFAYALFASLQLNRATATNRELDSASGLPQKWGYPVSAQPNTQQANLPAFSPRYLFRAERQARKL